MDNQQSEDRPRLYWHALYTRSHSEQLVCDQLAAKGFRIFLPTIDVWSQRAGKRHLISMPMFPSYLVTVHVYESATQRGTSIVRSPWEWEARKGPAHRAAPPRTLLSDSRGQDGVAA
jgi:hypothetical protein